MMKKKWMLILAGLLFAPMLALGAGALVRGTESQALTRAAPTAASFTVTSGSTIGASVEIQDMTGLFVYVCANSGQTLSGAGTLLAYALDVRTGEVIRVPDANFTVSLASVKCMGFNAAEVPVRAGFRYMWATSSVTVSSGTTVDLYYAGWRTTNP